MTANSRKRFALPSKSPDAGSQPSSNGEKAPYFVESAGAGRVEIVRAARAAGRENLPDYSAQEPSDVETAIVSEHERVHRDRLERARGELRELADAFGCLEHALPHPQDLHVAVEGAAAEVERDLSDGQPLARLRQEQSLRHRDLRHFMRERGLSREAHYPASRVLHLAFVAVLVVAESIGNSGFFALGSDLGLLGGFVLAVSVSLINVVTGCLAGFFCFRWRNSQNRRLRNVATAGVVAYVVFALLFNLAVARFRDAAIYAGGSGLVGIDQVLSLTHPLSLAGAALLVVGLIASVLSAWKGFRLDDAVPHFGDRHRRYKSAEADFSQARDKHHRQVLGHAESVPDRCRVLVRRAAEILEQLGQLVVRAEQCVEGYEAERERTERWACQWLKRFRTENEAVRTTKVPAYFASYPSFPSQLDAAPVLELQQRLGRAATDVEALRTEARTIEHRQPERVREADTRIQGFMARVQQLADAGHSARGTSTLGEPGGEVHR